MTGQHIEQSEGAAESGLGPDVGQPQAACPYSAVCQPAQASNAEQPTATCPEHDGVNILQRSLVEVVGRVSDDHTRTRSCILIAGLQPLVSTAHSETLVVMRLRALLPVAAATMLTVPAAASAGFPHIVAAGESLTSVAASDGLTVDQLAAANGLSPDASLTAGSTLTIPPGTPGVAGSEAGSGETESSSEETGSSTEGAASNAGSYVVQPGDTLSAIADRAGMSVEELAVVNGIDPNAPLLSGAVVRFAGSSTEAPPIGTPAAEGAQASEGSGSVPPYPTAETVTPSEVASIAAENGVPPSLAEAIAHQESGFNNDLTSSADARGVMQILPETWDWIGKTLAGPAPLAPASAASNVRGGVLLLHSLLNETGGDSALAAAGYYQGLSSVLQEGEAPSTEQYVGDVLALQRQLGGE
jgi:LysM repeat protein